VTKPPPHPRIIDEEDREAIFIIRFPQKCYWYTISTRPFQSAAEATP
jgi:hypothetical protein